MLKNEVVQTMSLNFKFSYLAKNSKFSRSNSYFLILTPTFLRDVFLNSYFQNPSENSDKSGIHALDDFSFLHCFRSGCYLHFRFLNTSNFFVSELNYQVSVCIFLVRM